MALVNEQYPTKSLEPTPPVCHRARGIRQFVVGTGGGKGTYPILDPIAHSEVHNDDAYGVLKLTLHPGSYEWRFVPAEGGEFTDSGSARCH